MNIPLEFNLRQPNNNNFIFYDIKKSISILYTQNGKVKGWNLLIAVAAVTRFIYISNSSSSRVSCHIHISSLRTFKGVPGLFLVCQGLPALHAYIYIMQERFLWNPVWISHVSGSYSPIRMRRLSCKFI